MNRQDYYRGVQESMTNSDSEEHRKYADFDPKNPGDDMRKAMDTQFDVADMN